MTDIILNTTTHDIQITDKDISLFESIEDLTAQKLKIILLSYRGEWFRDISTGIPYLQTILGKRNTKTTADTTIKNAIITTDNISSITNYTSSVNTSRKLEVSFSAIMTSGGSVTINNLEV